MAEEYTCIECENLYDDTDGDTDERMCIKCLNDAIKATPEYKLGKKLLDGEISNVTIDNIINNESGVE